MSSRDTGKFGAAPRGGFGNGVMLAGLDRLFAQADGVSLVIGDGNQFWFTLNEDDSYTARPFRLHASGFHSMGC